MSMVRFSKFLLRWEGNTILQLGHILKLNGLGLMDLKGQGRLEIIY